MYNCVTHCIVVCICRLKRCHQRSVILETTELVIDEVFLRLLAHKSKRIVTKTARAIAEIAKTERGREKCTSVELVRALIGPLKEQDVDMMTQASRALGNICYENGYCDNYIFVP